MDSEVKNKNKIINIVAIVMVVAIVAGVSTVFLTKHKKSEAENVTKDSVTSFSIIGNADSEKEDIYTRPEKNEKETTDAVTDKNGTTNKNKTTTTTNAHDLQIGSPQTPGDSSNVNPDSAKQEASTMGFAWDPVSGVFYSTSDPWQRQFGYNQYYDTVGGYIMLFYDTVRVKFNYGGYDWLVQFWKGQYGFLLLGAEAGVYYKDEGSATSQYICSDNNMRLKIGYTCYNKGEVLFTRAYQDTWWLTGFVPGRLDKFADRSQLKMKIRITLKDAGMRDAFVAALQQPGVGFTQGNGTAADTFYVSGNDVYLMWQSDRSKTS